MTYKDLTAALDIFDLGERATLKEIKGRHRELVKRHHPDSGSSDGDSIRKVNAAYRVLIDYVSDYRFSFTEQDFYQQNPDERLRHQFFDEEEWGKGCG
jgi:DnaJ-class molecular chaperone